MLREFINRLLGPSPWDSSDRRRRLRTPVDFAIEVLFPTFNCIGFAVDMGPTGIRVRIPADRDPHVLKGQLVQLKYDPPQFKGIHTIECKARWLRKEGEKNFSLGLVFDDTPENLRRSWVPDVLLDNLRGHSEPDRKHLRVQTDIEATFQVDGKEYSGYLRDLSATGGLLETALPVAEGTHFDLTLAFTAPHPPVTLEAVVCRSRRGKPLSQLGLAFMASAKQKKFLQQLVKALIAIQVATPAAVTGEGKRPRPKPKPIG